ncbi:MAG: LarC family nickel insertion protein [Desulfotalea sp.]
MTLCYLDCYAGISSDRLLAAFLDAGLNIKDLEEALVPLKIDFTLQKEIVTCDRIKAVSVCITLKDEKTFEPISHLQKSNLPDRITKNSIAVINSLIEAEKNVYALELSDNKRWTEIIVKTVAVFSSLSILGIDKIICASLPRPQGGSTISPANPISYEILKDIPCHGVDCEEELVSPLGAALIKQITTDFGLMPAISQCIIGYGATNGKDNNKLLRIILGNDEQDEPQEVEIISTNLDDWSPETHPYLTDKLLAAEALDVTITPIFMKKGRPGFCLQVIANPKKSEILKDIILSETTAIGLRFHLEKRRTLSRKVIYIDSKWGKIQAKEVETPKGKVIYPEYEACRIIAEKYNLPIQTIYRFVQGMNNE